MRFRCFTMPFLFHVSDYSIVHVGFLHVVYWYCIPCITKESRFSPLIFHALKIFETHSHFLKRQRLLLPEWNDSYDTGFPGHLRYFHRTFDVALWIFWIHKVFYSLWPLYIFPYKDSLHNFRFHIQNQQLHLDNAPFLFLTQGVA